MNVRHDTEVVSLPIINVLFFTQVSRCGYVVLLMAVYWCTECLPLSVTSFIPVILFPTLGIMTSKEVAVNYLNVRIIFNTNVK